MALLEGRRLGLDGSRRTTLASDGSHPVFNADLVWTFLSKQLQEAFDRDTFSCGPHVYFPEAHDVSFIHSKCETTLNNLTLLTSFQHLSTIYIIRSGENPRHHFAAHEAPRQAARLIQAAGGAEDKAPKGRGFSSWRRFIISWWIWWDGKGWNFHDGQWMDYGWLWIISWWNWMDFAQIFQRWARFPFPAAETCRKAPRETDGMMELPGGEVLQGHFRAFQTAVLVCFNGRFCEKQC